MKKNWIIAGAAVAGLLLLRGRQAPKAAATQTYPEIVTRIETSSWVDPRAAEFRTGL